jgi:hypothetical protein
MILNHLRSYLCVTAILVSTTYEAHAETIVKLNLGGTSDADVQLVDGTLSTVSDGVATSPGDQQTSVTFHGFVDGQNGLADISPPDQASFTLSGVKIDGAPSVVGIGGLDLITQPTMGGAFSLYDESGSILLEGSLIDGSLSGIMGAAGTGGFLTANLGTFTGPANAGLDPLFDLLDPNSASLSINLSDVISTSAAGAAPGLLMGPGNVLANFTADGGANIGAGALGQELPEPSGMTLGLLAALGLLTLRRRQAN